MQATLSDEFVQACRVAHCRGCLGESLQPILDFGPMPPSDRFVGSGELDLPDAVYPLRLVLCERCSLLQLLDTVEPELLFGENYLYYSSCSESWLEHARKNAGELIERYRLDGKSLVVEPASNDGYLLRQFTEQGIPVLGIDPAPGPVAAARDAGVHTINGFFGMELACRLRDGGTVADLVITNNVLAHVAGLHDFIQGVGEVLAPEGAWVIEVPYVGDLVEMTAFDTIYHEHLCYFSVCALHALLDRHGFVINDIRRLRSHGGSLRIFASRLGVTGEAVNELLARERREGMHQEGYYQAFASRALAMRDELAELLGSLARSGHSIGAYGAAAKGTMLLNCLGDAASAIEFAVDRNPFKQGKWIPGVRVPIHEPGAIASEEPDFLLLLPWNLRREILTQQAVYRERGGKFIIPFPSPTIV